jgi:hydroxypyruvate isomerase
VYIFIFQENYEPDSELLTIASGIFETDSTITLTQKYENINKFQHRLFLQVKQSTHDISLRIESLKLELDNLAEHFQIIEKCLKLKVKSKQKMIKKVQVGSFTRNYLKPSVLDINDIIHINDFKILKY